VWKLKRLNLVRFIDIILISTRCTAHVRHKTGKFFTQFDSPKLQIGIIELVLLQAFAYAIPAWAVGLAIGQGLIVLIAKGFDSLTEIKIPAVLTADAIGLATGLGILIPIAASIFPIRNALGKNLQDSLDIRHSKVRRLCRSLLICYRQKLLKFP
jgi:hypothetical protein